MHESDVSRTKRELRRALLAEQDMRLVVEELQAIDEDQYLYSRVVETGLVVTYARAYTLDSERRGLREELHPQGADVALHAHLMKLRNGVYAHTDETDAREAVDPFGDHGYAEQYRPMSEDGRRRLGELAARQQERLKAERERLEQVLRDAEVPPTPLD